MSRRTIKLKLRRGEATRPRSGHPWIYRNEVESIPQELIPGGTVDVVDHRGRFVGRGYANPASVILARLFSWRDEVIDERWLEATLRRAIALRAQLRPNAEAFRLIYSEGDGLPGLIVDRYGPVLVVQALTAGIDRLLPTIVSILQAECLPAAILARHDVRSRQLEGLPVDKQWLVGDWEGKVPVKFQGFDLLVDCWNGHKTGLYLDQADNYSLLTELVSGGHVIDGCCYTGLWSLHAARNGAAEVIGIDQSEGAVAAAEGQAAANGLADRCRFLAGNLFDELRRRSDMDERVDLIILDPPAFAKSRGQVEGAMRGYKEINLRAMTLLRSGGILLTSSCSYHLRPEWFRQLLVDAAGDLGRTIRMLAWRGQAVDHPALLQVEETEYLKCALLQID